MEPRMESIREKKLVGKRMKMSFADFRVGELWKNFMPETGKIQRKLNHDLISMTVYNPGYFANFNPANEFEKWAAVEVDAFENIPGDMETCLLPGGLYAVFHYKGLNTDNSIYQYIFGTWMPQSGYAPDNRPHFEVLGEKYRNNDPASEEEIYIPVKPV